VTEIQELLDGMDRQYNAMKTELLKLTWYMRGGVTYDQILMMNSRERDAIGVIIKENMETTKKSGLPFF
jgi:hypothetical protein